MAGLLDQYRLAGDDQAYSIVLGMADWVVGRVDVSTLPSCCHSGAELLLTAWLTTASCQYCPHEYAQPGHSQAGTFVTQLGDPIDQDIVRVNGTARWHETLETEFGGMQVRPSRIF